MFKWVDPQKNAQKNTKASSKNEKEKKEDIT